MAITREYDVYTVPAKNGNGYYKISLDRQNPYIIGVRGKRIQSLPTLKEEYAWIINIYKRLHNWYVNDDVLELARRLVSMQVDSIITNSYSMESTSKDLLENWKDVIKVIRERGTDCTYNLDELRVIAKSYWIIKEYPTLSNLDLDNLRLLASHFNEVPFKNNKKYKNYLVNHLVEVADYEGSDYRAIAKISGYIKMIADCDMPLESGSFFKNYIAVAKTYRTMKEEINTKKLLKQQTKHNYHFENELFEIVVPTTKNEFIEEGKALHNCLGSWELEKVLEGSRTVVFIREKSQPNTPYIACDFFNDGRISQFLGKYNRNVTNAKALAFKESFQEYLNEVFNESGE